MGDGLVRDGLRELSRARQNVIEAARKVGVPEDHIREALAISRARLDARSGTRAVYERSKEINEAFAAVGLAIPAPDLQAARMRDVEGAYLEELRKGSIEITAADLRLKTRKRPIAFPRFIGMWLCRVIAQSSFPEIARFYGFLDHTSVIHACGAGKTRALAWDGDLQIAARSTILRFHNLSTNDRA